MTDEEAKRMRALETMLTCFLKTDQYNAGKELVVCVDQDNQATVNFAFPPTQSEIDALIEHLQLMKKQRPETRVHISLDTINAALGERGIAAIEERR